MLLLSEGLKNTNKVEQRKERTLNQNDSPSSRRLGRQRNRHNSNLKKKREKLTSFFPSFSFFFFASYSRWLAFGEWRRDDRRFSRSSRSNSSRRFLMQQNEKLKIIKIFKNLNPQRFFRRSIHLKKRGKYLRFSFIELTLLTAGPGLRLRISSSSSLCLSFAMSMGVFIHSFTISALHR